MPPVIKIVKVYTWYDVYVNNTMILHHLSEQDINDIKKADKNNIIQYKEYN